MDFLSKHGYVEALREYLRTPGKTYLGICIGMQVLFESSTESPGVEGLGVIKGAIERFPAGESDPSVPQIGWNGLVVKQPSSMFASLQPTDRVYFVHSYRAKATGDNERWVASTTRYGADDYISAVQSGTVAAVQFHPEKSGTVGLTLIKNFLARAASKPLSTMPTVAPALSRRVVACLDVRTNDEGDLVVTKGDSYDVREASESAAKKGRVRNLGKPVELAKRYYDDGADEITFLNITSYRGEPLEDSPLLALLEEASKNIFVPLTIGGGIRDYEDAQGRKYTALQVADRYFRAGADKVSIGGDAVLAAERLLGGAPMDGTSCIEQISKAYGAQAVVISVDPKRVYLDSSEAERDAKQQGRTVVDAADVRPGAAPGARCKVWYQCTIKGGREARPLDAVQLCQMCERLGAGEILLNSIDMDGQKKGFDGDLIDAVAACTRLPIIASSGAGAAQHFVDVFQSTRAEAALAAGMFHRKEVAIGDVKRVMVDAGLPVRQ